MDNYPTLRLGVLHGLAALKASCDAEEGFLRKPASPYDNDTIKLLEALFEPKIVEVEKEVFRDRPSRGDVGRPSKTGKVSDDDAVELEEEARALLTELRQLDKTIEGEAKQLDTKTRLDIIKAKTTLMEKLVSIRERFAGVRRVADFNNVVISILDDLIPEDKIDEFMTRLEPFRSQG